jgi:hypothetical protein
LMNSPRASAWATTLVKASNIEGLLFSTKRRRGGEQGRRLEASCVRGTGPFFRKKRTSREVLYKGSPQR